MQNIAPDQAEDDAQWMRLALDQAHLAAAAGEVPVGAVVVKEGQVVALGRNAPIAGHDPTAHAEIVVLREAARALGNYRLNGCTLYVTLEPCAMCSGAMLHARLDRVVYGSPDPRTGAAGSVLDVLGNRYINHQTQITSGVLAGECAQLLKGFFKPKRINREPVREDALRTPETAFEGLPTLPGQARMLSDLPGLEGLRLHVVDTGPAHAQNATLWLHGLEGWSLAWSDAVQAALQAEPTSRHIIVDLLGFGRSDKPKKESFHQLSTHTHSLHALCERLALIQVHWVAAPSTAPLMQALQTAHPQRYRPTTVQATPMPLIRAWRDAPYPDAGHQAGPRGLARALAKTALAETGKNAA